MRLSWVFGAVAVVGWSAACAAQEGGAEAIETYVRGDYAAVVTLLGPAYQDGTASIQQRLLLARARLHLGQPAEALAVLQSVLETDRENPDANSLTGRILHEAGKHEEALEYLEQAYRLKQDPATASTLGRCHYALGDYSKAKLYLREALKEDIRDPTNSLLLGKICLSRGQGALAERYLLMAQEAGMDSVELHRLLGRAYLAQRKFVGPILTKRIIDSPRPGEIVDGHVVLGKVEGAEGTYKVCTRHSVLYESLRLLEAAPQDGDALFMLAAAWLDAGDPARARGRLKALAALEPDSERLLDLKARVMIAQGDFEAMEMTLNAARAQKVFDAPKLADLYYRAALVLRAEGKRAEAIEMLKKAERLAPTSGEVLRLLAPLCVATGRLDEARQYYARMVELLPDAADVDELRNALNILQDKTGAQL